MYTLSILYWKKKKERGVGVLATDPKKLITSTSCQKHFSRCLVAYTGCYVKLSWFCIIQQTEDTFTVNEPWRSWDRWRRRSTLEWRLKEERLLDQSASAAVLIATSCVYVGRMGKVRCTSVLWQRQQSHTGKSDLSRKKQRTSVACSTWVPRPGSRRAAWANFRRLAFLPANANKWANLIDSESLSRC